MDEGLGGMVVEAFMAYLHIGRRLAWKELPFGHLGLGVAFGYLIAYIMHIKHNLSKTFTEVRGYVACWIEKCVVTLYPGSLGCPRTTQSSAANVVEQSLINMTNTHAFHDSS